MRDEVGAEPGVIPLEQRILTRYTRRRLVLPGIIFLIGFAAYAACAAGAVVVTGTGAKLGLAALAGVFIANLAIIGHDAVHRSFTSSRLLNRVIGTLGFLAALHPFGAGSITTIAVHHRYTGQIGVDNAYSPMTGEQYIGRFAGAPGLLTVFWRSPRGQALFFKGRNPGFP